MVAPIKLHDGTLLKALALRDAGLSNKQIAKQLKSTEGVIERALHRIDVELALSELPREDMGEQRKCV